MPGIRVPPLMIGDGGKTELFGQLDIGYVFTFQSSSQSPPPPPPPMPVSGPMTSNDEYIGQLGIGLRRWLSPSFAVGVSAGGRYDDATTNTTEMSGGATSANGASASVTSVFGSFVVAGVL